MNMIEPGRLTALLKEAGAPFYRRNRLTLLIAGGALIALIAIWLFFLRGGDSMQYLTKEVRRGSLTATVTATGTLEPVVEVDVGTEVSGIIESVLVEENDLVKAGQVLARLDITRLEAQVNSSAAALRVAEAQVREAQATLTQAANDLKRSQSLVADGWRSPADLDAAQAAYDRAAAGLASAKARVQEAKATLDSNKTNLDKAVIRAPIDGLVLVRHVDPGQTVAATFQTPVLFTLAKDLRQMQVKANIDEADIGVVKAGARASFTVDAYPDRGFPAYVASVRFAPETVEGVVTYQAVLEVKNDELLLRPGMTATADIIVGEVKDRLLVPNAALRFQPPREPGAGREQPTAGDRVWLLKNGAPTAVAVSVGASDGVWSEIKSGELTLGQAVIVGVKQPTAAQP